MKTTLAVSKNRASAEKGDVLELFKAHSAKKGDFYMIPMPSLLGSSGSHLSMHASGETHFRAGRFPDQVTVRVPLREAFERARPENFKELAKFLLSPIASGYKAWILIFPFETNYLIPLSKHRIVFDLEELYRQCTVGLVDDTGNLPSAIKKLMDMGLLTPLKIAQIVNLETGEMNFLTPVSAMPSGTSEFANHIRTYNGILAKIPNDENGFPLSKMQMFKPLSEAMDDTAKKLQRVSIFKNPETPRFENYFSGLDEILRKKKVISL
jgi:hypothetical protein